MKALNRYSNKIAEISDERDTNNGLWVYYRYGWKSGTDPIGAQHQDVADSVTAAASYAKNAIKCDCAECAANAE